MLVIVCPGQGAQSPGMLNPWLDLEGVGDRLARLGEAAGLDLLAHGTSSDADTIRDTAVAQPLIVGAGLVAAAELLAGSESAAVGATAGHSVGEITAAALAGVLSETEAMSFVGLRGRSMAAASALTPTGMSAVVGGEAEAVLAAIEAAGLTAANVNGAGQVVAAGSMPALAALAGDPPARARVIPLSVAGAFHTEYMRPAVHELAAHAAGLSPSDPRMTLLSNADGAAVGTGAEVLERLVAQVSNPVRWDRCMATLTELGTTAMIELCPAGTLTNLAKRAMRGVPVVALRGPDDLVAARALLAEHGAAR